MICMDHIAEAHLARIENPSLLITTTEEGEYHEYDTSHENIRRNRPSRDSGWG